MHNIVSSLPLTDNAEYAPLLDCQCFSSHHTVVLADYHSMGVSLLCHPVGLFYRYCIFDPQRAYARA